MVRSLNSGVSGILQFQEKMDVIGNNIANVNTTAFKSARLNFSTLLSRTYSAGSGPGAASGGTNPYQVGLGVSTSGTQRNFTSGTLSPTGDPRDMAIDVGLSNSFGFGGTNGTLAFRRLR